MSKKVPGPAYSFSTNPVFILIQLALNDLKKNHIHVRPRQ